MKNNLALILFLMLFSSCVTSPLDREYKRYTDYKKALQKSVSRGGISEAEARQLDQKAYESYQAIADDYLSTPAEREYKRYLVYKKELQESVAQGKITQQQAQQLDQQAYQTYQASSARQLSYQERQDQLNAFDSILRQSLTAAENFQRQKSEEKFFSH